MAKTILVVDDEEYIRDLIKVLLESEGFVVVEAASGKEALASLRTQKPDVILVDYYMPEMNGKELVEQIRNDPQLEDMKVVFLTVAQFGRQDLKDIKNLGVIDYIQKPFENQDLIQRLKQITA
jgi:two-component system, OmpR family, response regulator